MNRIETLETKRLNPTFGVEHGPSLLFWLVKKETQALDRHRSIAPPRVVNQQNRHEASMLLNKVNLAWA